MSEFGTTRTCEDAYCLTGFGGKADIERRLTQAQSSLKNFFGKNFGHNPRSSSREIRYGTQPVQGCTGGQRREGVPCDSYHRSLKGYEAAGRWWSAAINLRRRPLQNVSIVVCRQRRIVPTVHTENGGFTREIRH